MAWKGFDVISIGVDLGKMRDHSAIAVVRRPETFVRTATLHPWTVIDERRDGPAALIHMEKIPLGTPYVKVVERIRQVAQHPELGAGKRQVVVDATGVGMPVVDMLRAVRLGCELKPVTITGGMGENYSRGIYSVGRSDLLSGLRSSLETKWMEIGKGQRIWPELRKQLIGFGGCGADDLVLAFALAAWGARAGERYEGAPAG